MGEGKPGLTRMRTRRQGASPLWGLTGAICLLGAAGVLAVLANDSQATAPQQQNGVAFSGPVLLSDPAHTVGEPQAAVGPEGNIYAAWGGGPLECPSRNIYFGRSTDGGQSFSPSQSLSGFPCDLQLHDASLPKVSVDAAGTIYVVWDLAAPDAPGNQVYFTRSADGGQSFTQPKNISNSPSNTAYSSAVAGGAAGQVCAVWEDEYDPQQYLQIFISCSTDSGGIFSPPLQVSFHSSEWVWSYFPEVAMGPAGVIYVAWSQVGSAGSDIFFSRSIDGGQSFSMPMNLSERVGYSAGVRLEVDPAGTLYVVWTDDAPGAWEVMFRRSEDGGLTFSRRKRLSGSDGAASTIPEIATGSAGRIFVTWSEYGPKESILLTRSRDGGRRFHRPVKVPLTSDALNAVSYGMAADAAGNVYVVYPGGLPDPAWWYGIYFTRTVDPLP